MKSKRLLAAMGNIDDRFISEDAETFSAGNKIKTSTPFYRNRNVFRFAGLAACVAVVLFCVWAVPGLFNRINPVIDNPDVITSDNTQNGNPTDVAVNTPADPNPITPEIEKIWSLTLNKVDSQFAGSISIEGHFWNELTDEQISMIFPDLPFPLSATANYRGDGSLYNIMAYEASANGEPAFYNDFYTATTIEVIGAGGGSMEDVIYEYEPVTTDIWGVPVIAGVFDFKKNDGVALYIAKFTVGDTAYNIKIHDDDAGDSGKDKLSLVVNRIIYLHQINGSVDLSILNDPVMPELRDEILTLDEARNDPDFGAYLPENIPSRYVFESAQRVINQETDCLFVNWNVGMDYINWQISKPTEYDFDRIVSADEKEKYDMSLYPIPWAESIPTELWDYVLNPVFRIDELTLDIIKARAYYVENDQGDTPNWRMAFSVLYDNVIVRVNIKGVTPEQVWEMFAG